MSRPKLLPSLLPPVVAATLLAQGALAKEPAHPGLNAADFAQIQNAYFKNRHAIVRLPDGAARAENPGQNWSTRFDGKGFLTTPKEGSWTWGLTLNAVGFEGSTQPVEETVPITMEENRLVYHPAPDVHEWFVNGRNGLQQGWTISKRPKNGSGTLNLDLAVRGDLVSHVSKSSVEFRDDDGVAVLTYAGLTAWDANGRILPTRFQKVPEGLCVAVDEKGATYPVTIDPVAQLAYLKASNTDANDNFGASVAVSGDRVVVGAPQEDGTAVGVNGNDALDGVSNSGAAYVFVRNGNVWSQEAYFKASNREADDRFGESVAISGDRIVVGAPAEDGGATGVNGADNNAANGSGAAYVFVRIAGVWSEEAYLKASNTGLGDSFGTSVAISGATVVVGADIEDSNSTEVDGANNNLSPESGAAYVFFNDGVSWSQQAFLKASNTSDDDRFGESVSVSGDRVVVGAPREDSTAADSGAIYIYQRTGGTWAFDMMAKAANAGADDELGSAVSISGDRIVAGAPNEDSPSTGVNGGMGDGTSNSGAAYVFFFNGTGWVQEAYLKTSTTSVGNAFGSSVSISGDMLVVGAHFEDSDSTGINGSEENLGAGSSGAAYVFQRAPSFWFQQAYVKATNTQFNDQFGTAVAIDGETALVTAVFEDSIAVGIGGNQASNGALESGAAYAFAVTPMVLQPGGQQGFVGPVVRINGKKSIRTKKQKVVIRGTASASSGIARVEYKAGKGGFKRARLSGASWTAQIRVKKGGRVVVNVRAVDALGNVSATAKARVINR